MRKTENKFRSEIKKKIDEGWEDRRKLLRDRSILHNDYTKKWKKGLIETREYLFEQLKRYERLGP